LESIIEKSFLFSFFDNIFKVKKSSLKNCVKNVKLKLFFNILFIIN